MKFKSVIALVAVLALFAASCGEDEAPAPDTSAADAEAAAAEAEAEAAAAEAAAAEAEAEAAALAAEAAEAEAAAEAAAAEAEAAAAAAAEAEAALEAAMAEAEGAIDPEVVAELEAQLEAAQAEAAAAAAEAAAAAAAAEEAMMEAEPMVQAVDIRAALNADLNNCAPAPTGEPIRVGMAMDFSDVVGFVDIPGSKLVPHFANLINCTGGVNGSPVEVRVEDVGGDATTAGVAAEQLLDWGAHFLIGPPFADFTLPILQATGGQVPVFVAASTEPTLSDIENNSFLVTFDDRGQSSAAAEWALDQGITRAFVFTQPGPYTGYNPDVFKEVFEAGGGEIVAEHTYEWFVDTDFSAQVAELSEVLQNNEAFFSAALGYQVTALRGQLEGAGFDSITYIGTDALDATGIAFEANNEGIVHTPHINVEPGGLNDRLLQGYSAAHDGEVLESQGFMGLYVDSLLLGIQGIVNCGCTDSAQIGDAVAQIEGFEGFSGTITYVGTTGTPPKAVPIKRIVNGQDVLIEIR
ncbi:MAG: ABC transporter substrate-binding protein [Acidimicrobiaceae bacterium]|nr:ABC transporter substrate-binding protein [Acidimicrobiaceae bacterium]